MSTIYRKTDLGQAEIETRARRLAPRLRSALIVVDGRRSDAELHKLILQDPGATLQALAEQGFIEAVAVAKPATRAPGATPSQSPAEPAGDADVRREAVRMLTDQAGPAAEGVAIKIERARNPEELHAQLLLGQQLLRNLRGPASAEAFGKRFIDANVA